MRSYRFDPCPFCYRGATVTLNAPQRWWRWWERKRGRKKIKVCDNHIIEGVKAVRK